MCIVIDVNCLMAVFSNQDNQHDEFKLISKWILNKGGKLVYGGSSYKRELSKLRHFRFKFLVQLISGGYVLSGRDIEIDNVEKKIKDINTSKKFNDTHLAAIVDVYKCRVICTQDKDSHRFLKAKKYYSKSTKPPSIYSCGKCKTLLNKKNLEPCKNC